MSPGWVCPRPTCRQTCSCCTDRSIRAASSPCRSPCTASHLRMNLMRLNWFRRFRLDGVTFRLGTAIRAKTPSPCHAPDIARVESAPRARAAAAHLGNPECHVARSRRARRARGDVARHAPARSRVGEGCERADPAARCGVRYGSGCDREPSERADGASNRSVHLRHSPLARRWRWCRARCKNIPTLACLHHGKSTKPVYLRRKRIREIEITVQVLKRTRLPEMIWCAARRC
jgi:hypothetical protein